MAGGKSALAGTQALAGMDRAVGTKGVEHGACGGKLVLPASDVEMEVLAPRKAKGKAKSKKAVKTTVRDAIEAVGTSLINGSTKTRDDNPPAYVFSFYF
jgi:hypothetical protein